MTQLLRQVAGSRVAGNFVMLDTLCGADQGEIRGGIVLPGALLDHFVAFLDKSLHTLAGLGARLLAEQLEALVETFDLRFGFGQMNGEQLAELIVACSLDHLGQRLGQLLLSMEKVPQLVDQQVVKADDRLRRRTLGYDRRRRAGLAALERRGFHELPVFALIPGTARVDFTVVAGSRRIVEELVHEAGRRRDAADAERGLVHAFQRARERLHVGDLPRHQELQGVLGARVVAEIDQPFVDYLGAGLRSDVAAQVDVEFAGDFEVVGGPGVALRVEQADATASGDRDQGIGFRRFAIEFQRLQVQARKRSDDFEVAQFLGSDIHQEILAVRIFAIETLNGVLHGGGELAVSAAELFQQHVAEPGIGLVDANCEHELLDVVVHGKTFASQEKSGPTGRNSGRS
ncbi:hypothetical protein AB7M42_003873 [Bradyrhizobium diazoefficiens]